MIVVKGITKGEVKVKNKGEYKDLPWSLCDQVDVFSLRSFFQKN